MALSENFVKISISKIRFVKRQSNVKERVKDKIINISRILLQVKKYVIVNVTTTCIVSQKLTEHS